MAIETTPVVITNAATTLIAAPGANKYLLPKAALVTNRDSVTHTIVFKYGATEVGRLTVGSGSSQTYAFSSDRAGAVGRPVAANTAITAETLAAPTANTVTANADYTRAAA